MQYAVGAHDDPNLGGILLYVGELEDTGRIYTTAANIAGAASLAASEDSAVLRSAQRAGVIDFLVNSLDEALRIVKNEIRKHQPVSVAVSRSPALIEEEMLDRGVLPNLVLPQLGRHFAVPEFLAQGTQRIATAPADSARDLCVWTTPAESSQGISPIEAILADQIPSSDHLNHRWLRLSPRYLGRSARRLRSIPCNQATAERLAEKLGPPIFRSKS